MDFVKLILDNGLEIAGGVVLVLTGLYTIFLVIPGDQPDKTIKALLDFTKKFSNK